MSDLTLTVEPREAEGKNANRRLRAAGKVPAVVYGGDLDPATIQVDDRNLRDLLRGTADDNPIFLLKLAGTKKSRHAMIRDMQVDPIRGDMIHIDFQRVKMDEEVRVTVPIELHGTPKGVKDEGGMLDFIMREIEISVLPGDIPGHIDLDVAALHIGQHIEAGELDLPKGVTLLDDADRVIVSVHGRAALELPEDEEAAEDDVAEPVVITKGKAEDED